MSIASATKKLILSLIPLVALVAASESVLAQNGLAISSDEVTITATGFNQTKNLSSTPGVIPATDSIPTGAINSNLSFSFTYAPASGKTPQDGSYTYAAGMYIDQDGTDRRLEMTISNITITIGGSGATLSGSVASGSNALVSGRSANGSVQAQITLSNSTLNFSGSTLSVNIGNQVNEIQTSTNQILQDLTNTFSAAASYEYGVYLKQTGGPAGLTLGLANGTTVFGCAPSDPLILNGQNTSFQGAYALKGRMGIGQAAGGSVTALATGTSNCITSPALSTGTSTSTGSDTTTTEETETTTCPAGQVLSGDTCVNAGTAPADSITSVDSAVTVTEAFVVSDTTTTEEVEGLTLAVTNTVNSVLALIPQSTDATDTTPIQVDKAAVSNAIRAVKALLNVNSQAADRGVAVQSSAVVGALRQQRTLVRALSRSDTPLTENEKSDVRTNLRETLTALTNLNLRIGGTTAAGLSRRARATSGGDLDAVALTGGSADLLSTLEAIDEVGGIISSALQADIEIDDDFLSDIRGLVSSSVSTVLDDVGAVVDPTDPALRASFQSAAATRALLADNPQMLASLLEVVGITLDSESGVNVANLQSSLNAAGLRSSNAQALAENIAARSSNPTGVAFQLFNGELTAVQSIVNALGSGVSASYNSAAGTVELTTDGQGFPVYVQSVNVVSDSFPDGVFNLPDGRLITISDGMASVHAPALADVVAFAGALTDARATMTINEDGALSIEAPGFTFIGSPGFSVAPLTTGTGEVSVSGLTGEPTEAGYAFTLDFGNGMTQQILPNLEETSFYTILSAQGFDVATDRSSGIISVTTPAGETFRFKPDFFLATPNQEDLSFRQNNGGLLAPAFRPVDANGDGITDYRVIIGANVQVLYGLP